MRCAALRAAVDEEIRHGDEQVGRLGRDGAASGKLARTLLRLVGELTCEVAAHLDATAQVDELDGPGQIGGVGGLGLEQRDEFRARFGREVLERPDHGERALALGDVAAEVLALRVGVAHEVEQVILKLEREARWAAELNQPRGGLLVGPSGDRPMNSGLATVYQAVLPSIMYR